MADTVGFEPTKELPLYTLSKRAPSTARPRVRTVFVRISLSENRRTSPLPRPATHRVNSLGGRVRERAGTASIKN